MDSSIEQKQTYLRTQILEAGLDGAQFMAFLITTNAKKGDDLEQWSGHELIKVVIAFKKSKGIKVEEPKKEQKKEEKIVQSPQKVDSMPELPSPTKRASLHEDHLYVQQINCQQKIMNSIYKQNDLTIKVTKHDKVQGGAFERAYVRFTVATPSLSSIVYRRYNQFAWLRDTLSLLYPGFPVPPLPKKGKTVKFEQKYLNKRMYMLEKFLNTIAKTPELCSDGVFQKFLTSADSKEFEKYRNQYNKLDNNLPLRKIKTIDGHVSVTTEKVTTSRIMKIQQFLKDTQPEIRKIYKNFKGVATNFEAAAELFKAIGGNCNHLIGRQNALRSQIELPELETKTIFQPLQILSNKYAQQLLQHAKSFRKEIYSMVKYESLYKLNLLEMVEQLKVKEQEYQQHRNTLMKKKEKLFSEGKMSKWGLKDKDIPKPANKQEAFDIMLPKQSNQVLKLREYYGLCNAQLYEECYRHTKYFHKQLSTSMREFLQLQLKISNQTTESFFDVVTKIKDVETFYQKQMI